MLALLPIAFLPFALFAGLRVVLRDPREPTVGPSRLGFWSAFAVGVLPLAFMWAPRSALFNASLALALSTTITPTLLSAMNTEGTAWIKDKVFVAIARPGVAAALIYPLAHFKAFWFWGLAGLALASFWTRGSMYVSMGGSQRDYAKAFGSLFVVFISYGVLVEHSNITPCTWTHWTDFLTGGEPQQCVEQARVPSNDR